MATYDKTQPCQCGHSRGAHNRMSIDYGCFGSNLGQCSCNVFSPIAARTTTRTTRIIPDEPMWSPYP